MYAILPMVWTREVLSTHSVSGRQSNARTGRDAKPQLDVAKVDSICSELKTYINIKLTIY